MYLAFLNPLTFGNKDTKYQINGMFTAPTAIRAIKKEDEGGHYASKYDLSSLKYLFVAGEHCDYDTR